MENLTIWNKIGQWKFFQLISPYSAFQIIYQLAYLFSSLLCLRWILPEEVGVWQTMLLVESYMMFSRFGVFNAFNREFPYFLGKGDNQRALQFLSTAEFFAICLCIIYVVCLPLSLLFYNPAETPLWSISVLALALVAPMNIYRNFMDLTYRTSKDFALLAKVQVRMTLLVIPTVLLVYLLGYQGYLLRFIFLGVAALSLYIYYRAQPFKPRLIKPEFKYLFKEGLPLFYSNYLQNIVKGFPKIIILFFSSMTVLGLFSPVQAVLSLGVLIPSSISLYLLPKLNFDYGKNDSKKEIISNGFKAAGISMLIMLPIVLILWFLMPPVIKAFLPNFVESIFPMQLALILSVFTAFKISFNVFTVLKEWSKMYIYLGFLLLVQALIPFTIIKLYPDQNILVMLIISLIIAEIIMILVSITTIKNIK